jgi:G:T-mismatch repair DNA endonuclease (very short patch repair protein)
MIFKISEDTVASLLRCDGKVFRVSASECPADAKVAGVFFDHPSGCFWIRMESQSFEPVPEGCQIPNQNESVWLEEIKPELINPR